MSKRGMIILLVIILNLGLVSATCADSDSSQYSWNPATVLTPGATGPYSGSWNAYDMCALSDTAVYESYCDGATPKRKMQVCADVDSSRPYCITIGGTNPENAARCVECRSGADCPSGDCDEVTHACSECNDPDATVYPILSTDTSLTTKSITTTESSQGTDVCTSQTTIEEFYCDGLSLASDTVSCPANNICTDGACTHCGEPNQPCCPGELCSSPNTICVDGTCTSCGGNEEICCSFEFCDRTYRCEGDNVCRWYPPDCSSPEGYIGEVSCTGADLQVCFGAGWTTTGMACTQFDGKNSPCAILNRVYEEGNDASADCTDCGELGEACCNPSYQTECLEGECNNDGICANSPSYDCTEPNGYEGDYTCKGNSVYECKGVIFEDWEPIKSCDEYPGKVSPCETINNVHALEADAVQDCTTQTGCVSPEGNLGEFACRGGTIYECVIDAPFSWSATGSCNEYLGETIPCETQIARTTELLASEDCTDCGELTQPCCVETNPLGECSAGNICNGENLCEEAPVTCSDPEASPGQYTCFDNNINLCNPLGVWETYQSCDSYSGKLNSCATQNEIYGDDKSASADCTSDPGCVPDCTGKTCGDDGCGGFCPPDNCAANQYCDTTQNCADAVCGDDICNGLEICGETNTNPECNRDCGECPEPLHKVHKMPFVNLWTLIASLIIILAIYKIKSN